jgi:hypothetical protein
MAMLTGYVPPYVQLVAVDTMVAALDLIGAEIKLTFKFRGEYFLLSSELKLQL